MFFVVEIVASVLVALWDLFILFPFTLAMFHSLFEFTDILGARLPFVDPVAIRSTVQILPGVLVLVCEVICTLTILQ